MFQNGGDRTGFSRQCHNAGSSFFGAVEVSKSGCLEDCRAKSIAVVKTRSNKCMNDLLSGTFVQVLENLTYIPDVI